MTGTVEFSKWVAAGNDFIVIDNRKAVIGKDAKKVARLLSDRKQSIGADGLLLLEKSKTSDVRMRIFNSDGSEAEMCGNGVRCLAKFASDRHITKPKLSIETAAGVISAEIRGDQVRAKMVDPKGLRLNLAIQAEGSTHAVHFIDTGVPHAVEIVRDLESMDTRLLGRAIRFHAAFAPHGANVDFISIVSERAICVRTYERGVEDETLACGTGATASALVAASLGKVTSPVSIQTRGGEALKIRFSKKGDVFSNVTLEGKIKTSFEGRVRL